MGADMFQKPPKLERAHRTLGPRPRSGGSSRPRAFVVCFPHFREKAWALRWARLNELKYKGTVLRTYLDLSTVLAKKRASFNSIKQILYQRKTAFHLLYPTRLRITVGDETHVFETPEEAKSWYDRHVAQE